MIEITIDAPCRLVEFRETDGKNIAYDGEGKHPGKGLSYILLTNKLMGEIEELTNERRRNTRYNVHTTT